jgi:hypothetical protein
MTLDEYFSTGPPFERPVFDAVMAFLETLGPVHVEPVSVGIFIKTSRSFLELRPLTKWVNAGFRLDGYRKVRLRGPDDLTDEVKDLLRQAYDRNVSGP